MATVTGFTAERMLEIQNDTVVGGSINAAGSLILSTRGGTAIDAGIIKGPQGDVGPQGKAGIPGGTTLERDALFGVPTNEPEQVFFANEAVSWFNVDTGWFETYRATTGSTGLTVPGVSGSPGWYPIDAPVWYQPDKQMTLSRSNFAWGANSPWDAGALLIDNTPGAAAQTSVPQPTFCEPGSVSGSIRFLETGLYDVYWYIMPAKDPGNSSYRILPTNPWPGMDPSWGSFGHTQRPAGTLFWESLVLAPGIRVPTVGLEIRLTGQQANAALTGPKVKIIKRGGSF